jgi:hypothetical protein
LPWPARRASRVATLERPVEPTKPLFLHAIDKEAGDVVARQTVRRVLAHHPAEAGAELVNVELCELCQRPGKVVGSRGCRRVRRNATMPYCARQMA